MTDKIAALEKRVAALETEVAWIKRRLGEASQQPEPWWREIAGRFANDPIYDEAMRLGREYRESLRPKPKRKRR